MNAPKRNRARVLTPDGLKKLRERLRSQEMEANSGYKYTLERLGELTGLDPETVKNVLDCKGSDKRTIARCFESFGLTLEDSDHISATSATAAIADPNFVGREGAIADLNVLVSRNARVIVIQARGGVGKTTLARKYLQQEFGSFLEFPIAKETKDIASIEGLIEEKLRQLGEEPGREFLVSIDRLKRKLQNERIGILIDNLEPALDAAGKFIEAHRRYVELLRVLCDPTVQSVTLITSRERLREADVTVQHYSLRSLDVQAWSQFFQSRGINTETPALAALHDAYGGNAKAMDIISGAVLEDFSGNVEAYWQANQDDLFIERDLEDLVTKQFDRLQQLDPDAYKLLCRMGCYRYQDVPTVPIEGLFCLLWDIAENRHRRVIKALQDRSLTDLEDGEFWLHPVIRAEAVSRLRVTEDLELTNHKAAEFWTDSIKSIETLEDAIKAFESYYHYISINDFNLASRVIIKERENRWFKERDEGETVGWSFYRLGLLKRMIIELSFIKDKVVCRYPLSKIYSLLGVMHWALGAIQEAIKYFDESRRLAITIDFSHLISNLEDDRFRLKVLEIDYFINVGLCKIDLWELEEALSLFEQAALRSKDESKLELYFSCSKFYALHPNSYFLSKDKLYGLVEDLYNALPKVVWGSRARGYSLVFLALAYKTLCNWEKAIELYKRAIEYAVDSDYPQIKGKALTGLAEVYRENRQFEEAILNLHKAVEILSSIGAKSDLAESFYQLGITYQTTDEEKSINIFQEAIRLFSEIEAPKQVERVRRSMKIANKNGENEI